MTSDGFERHQSHEGERHNKPGHGKLIGQIHSGSILANPGSGAHFNPLTGTASDGMNTGRARAVEEASATVVGGGRRHDHLDPTGLDAFVGHVRLRMEDNRIGEPAQRDREQD